MDPMLAIGDKTASRLRALMPKTLRGQILRDETLRDQILHGQTLGPKAMAPQDPSSQRRQAKTQLASEALARLRGRGDAALSDRTAGALAIPTATDTTEDRLRHDMTSMGQFLARQERWDDLGHQLRDHDRARAATPAGLALSGLLAHGARADVVAPIETALTDPRLMPAHAPKGGMAALEEVLQDHAGDYGVALVVAEAYIDIGWAWRGQGWQTEVPPSHLRQFHTHFARAADILDGFDPISDDSPALAAARCALLVAAAAPRSRVCDDYEDLIDLDPQNPRHLRIYGYHLLPRWFGSYDLLAGEAARTSARLADIWGADGGYALVLMDAVAVDPGALAVVDADRMSAGFVDILARRDDQHMVNDLAAYCAVTLTTERFRRIAEHARARAIAANFDWILQRHLREIHPLVWGIAGQAPDRSLPALEDLSRLGRTQALLRIARHFERDLRRGGRVVAGASGLWVEPAGLTR